MVYCENAFGRALPSQRAYSRQKVLRAARAAGRLHNEQAFAPWRRRYSGRLCGTGTDGRQSVKGLTIRRKKLYNVSD